MFWPFAMKAVAKKHNKMQIDVKGRTPESILHNVKIEDILVKSYHTLCNMVSGALTIPRRQHGISVESNHRESKPPISCSVRQQFYNSALHVSRHTPTQLGESC